MKIRIILSTLLAAAITLLTPTAAAQPAQDDNRTWYVCNGDNVPLRAWGSATAPIVGYLPAKTQVWGQTFGDRTFVVIRDGAREGTYLPVANACTATSTGAAQQWMERGERYVARAIELDDDAQRPDFYSRLAQGIAQSSAEGWFDPRAQAYLDRLLSTEIGSGGFGIGYEWDAFQDGSVNPADTAYTVTMVTHIGDAVLAAFDAGALEDPDVIQRIVNRVQSIGSVSRQPDCIAYSEAPSDAAAGYCTHNVNAAAAVFLINAAERGFTVDLPRAYRMLMQEVGALKGGQWLYMTGNPRKSNDPDHGAYQLKSVSEVLPELVQPIINAQMSKTFTYRSAEAHTVLAQLACADSLRWLPEHDAAAAGYWGNPDRMAYFAMEATDAGVKCE